MRAEASKTSELRTEALIRSHLDGARRKLEEATGISRDTRHFTRAPELPFTASQRSHTTLLFGGLTRKHDELIQGALEGLGYQCQALPVPDVRSFQIGKEYGNNGQCNPAYFTVGTLVRYLQELEEKGMSRQEIIDKYVFFTAGTCGPCRFGMYEAEYRLALRNAGFEGFRILLFKQTGGLNQAEAEAGLVMDLDFFVGILNALNMGDLITEVCNQIRPYEVNAGDTDRALDEIMPELHDVMRSRQRLEVEGGLGLIADWIPALEERAIYYGKLLAQITGDELVRPMERARDRLARIEVDRLRVKPLVKITGEFWAQTTEGDGNFNMFSFLERENAQVLAEPVATWICYILRGAQNRIQDRKGLDDDMVIPSWRNPWRRGKLEWVSHLRTHRLSLALALFKREYERLRRALGGTAHRLVDQIELERMGHPFYNSRAGGGEGHLEVAKNIYYHSHDLCHMVLSLKPFGCMPSTQSDGAQAAVISRYPDMIYLPIETSGENEINAHSRVQMALGEARTKAREEFARALCNGGYPLAQIRAYVKRRAELRRSLYKVPRFKGYVGVAANFALHVADRMKKEGIRPTSRVTGGTESCPDTRGAHGKEGGSA